jgi:hypothetical protein
LTQQISIQGVNSMVSKSNTSLMKKGDRRITLRLALAAVLTAGLAACGGGGGGSDDVDLRAAYDRINRDCMTYTDVEKAVGRTADEAPNAGRRNWRSGNQQLFVTFGPGNSASGTFYAGTVTWNLIGSQELVRDFFGECS